MAALRIAVAAALLAGTSSADAQSRRVETSLVDALAACLDIKDAGQRLACSDAAGRRLVDAVRRKDVVVVDGETVRSTRRSLFGFSLPRVGLFGDDPDTGDRDEIREVEGRITRVADLGYGKYALTLESGARWNTTESWAGVPQPSVGATLTIKRGALGSYMVKVGGSRAVRAIRVG